MKPAASPECSLLSASGGLFPTRPLLAMRREAPRAAGCAELSPAAHRSAGAKGFRHFLLACVLLAIGAGLVMAGVQRCAFADAPDVLPGNNSFECPKGTFRGDPNGYFTGDSGIDTINSAQWADPYAASTALPDKTTHYGFLTSHIQQGTTPQTSSGTITLEFTRPAPADSSGASQNAANATYWTVCFQARTRVRQASRSIVSAGAASTPTTAMVQTRQADRALLNVNVSTSDSQNRVVDPTIGGQTQSFSQAFRMTGDDDSMVTYTSRPMTLQQNGNGGYTFLITFSVDIDPACSDRTDTVFIDDVRVIQNVATQPLPVLSSQSYNLTLDASGLSTITGTNAAVNYSYNLMTPSFDTGNFDKSGSKSIPVLGTFGGGIAGQVKSTGNGLGFNFSADGGTVTIHYPAGITLSYPTYLNQDPSGFDVNVSYKPDPAASVSTTTPNFNASMTAIGNMTLYLAARATVFGYDILGSNGNNYTLIDNRQNPIDFVQTLLTLSQSGLTFAGTDSGIAAAYHFDYPPPDDADPATGKGVEEHAPVFSIDVKIPEADTTGSPGSVSQYQKSSSDFPSAPTLDQTGINWKALASYTDLDPPPLASKNSGVTYGRNIDNFFTLTDHISNMIWAIATEGDDPPSPFNGSENFTLFGFGVSLAWQILNADLEASLGVLQDATFSPNPVFTLTAVDSYGRKQVRTSELSPDSVTAFHFTMPPDIDPTTVNLTMTPQINFASQLETRWYLALTDAIDFTPLSAQAEIDASVFSLPFEADPLPQMSATLTEPFLMKDLCLKDLPLIVSGSSLSPYKLYCNAYPIPAPAAMAPINLPTDASSVTITAGGLSQPLPGQTGADTSAGSQTQLFLDPGRIFPGESSQRMDGMPLSTGLTNGTGVVPGNEVAAWLTPGTHHIRIVSSIGATAGETVQSRETTLPQEVRLPRPLIMGLYTAGTGMPSINDSFWPVAGHQYDKSTSAATQIIIDTGGGSYPNGSLVPFYSRALLDGAPLNLVPVLNPAQDPPLLGTPDTASQFYAIAIPNSLFNVGGVHTLELVTEGPGGGRSQYYDSSTKTLLNGPFRFTVQNQTPVLAGISPSIVNIVSSLPPNTVTSTNSLSPGATLTLTGSNFTATTEVLINGNPVDVYSDGSYNPSQPSVHFQGLSAYPVPKSKGNLNSYSNTITVNLPQSYLQTAQTLNIAVKNQPSDTDPVTGNPVYLIGQNPDATGISNVKTVLVQNPQLVLRTVDDGTGPGGTMDGTLSENPVSVNTRDFLAIAGKTSTNLHIYPNVQRSVSDGTGTTLVDTNGRPYSAAHFIAPNSTDPTTGTQFYLNGVYRPAKIVDGGDAYVTLTSTDTCQAGVFTITASNPGPTTSPGSNTITYVLLNPKPSISSLSPVSIPAGTKGATVTVNGTNFFSDTVILVNGGRSVTRWMSRTQIRITLTTAQLVTPGQITIQAVNPAVITDPNVLPPGVTADGGSSAIVSLPVTGGTGSYPNITVTRGTLTIDLATGLYRQAVTVTNTGSASESGPIYIILNNLQNGTLQNASGYTTANGTPPAGRPYMQVGTLAAGASQQLVFLFQKTANSNGAAVSYDTQVSKTTP